MNKLSKGLIAGSAGLVLVATGLTSLALWNDSAQIDAGAVDSGEMNISANAGAWATGITQWVPGDEDTYDAGLVINLAGDNLTSRLTIDAASITGDPELLAALVITLTPGTAVGGATVTPVAGQSNTFDIVADNPTQATTVTLPVSVSVDFPEDSVTDTVAQNQSVDLSGLSFALTQLAP